MCVCVWGGGGGGTVCIYMLGMCTVCTHICILTLLLSMADFHSEPTRPSFTAATFLTFVSGDQMGCFVQLKLLSTDMFSRTALNLTSCENGCQCVV